MRYYSRKRSRDCFGGINCYISFLGILGLKLIRVWNAVIGFVAGALLGFAVTYLMGLEVVPVLIAAGVAGLVFAILNSVFKKFGAFWVCFLGMAGTVLAITNAGNWIMLAVCGAVGLIFRNPCDDLV